MLISFTLTKEDTAKICLDFPEPDSLWGKFSNIRFLVRIGQNRLESDPTPRLLAKWFIVTAQTIPLRALQFSVGVQGKLSYVTLLKALVSSKEKYRTYFIKIIFQEVIYTAATWEYELDFFTWFISISFHILVTDSS